MDTPTKTVERSARSSIVMWAVAPLIWAALLVGWLYLISNGPVSTITLVVLLALPAPWLLWASWRMPRPRADTYLAEGGALLTGFIALYLATLTYMMFNEGPAPVELMVVFFAAAAVFIAAAVPLPGRRIAYGAAALACVILGIGLRVLYSGTSYYPGIDFITKDELFAWAFLGLPALGALLQVLWWLRGRSRVRSA
ncbi:hypothetical protein [Glycomyces tritici]|uniref:Uncharacterized protein n=1 Tax=Glycomyces tritici TaxID=2665176 RepID=A0ABT7YR24_9ACTN|nr:hypothetical protein [Glycomyces tritici]MDN3241091.1 hypothetical protein [Glycomyces tritici]